MGVKRGTRPGRPAKEKGLYPQELLDVARICFAKFGYDGASLREIAAVANIDVALLNYYFGSKMELWKSVVDALSDTYAKQLAQWKAPEDRKKDVRALLESTIEHLVRTHLKYPELGMLISNEAVQGSDRFEYLFAKIIKPYHDLALPLIEKGMALAIIPKQDSGMYYFMLVHAIAMPTAMKLLLGKFTAAAKDDKKLEKEIINSVKLNFLKA